eukprot:jgi/Tetstr1/428254/TSEL_018293.t1
MMVVGVEMQQYHTEPKLLRVGDDNLCTISLGKEDEEFADTLRMAKALTSPVALMREGAAHLSEPIAILSERPRQEKPDVPVSLGGDGFGQGRSRWLQWPARWPTLRRRL